MSQFAVSSELSDSSWGMKNKEFCYKTIEISNAALAVSSTQFATGQRSGTYGKLVDKLVWAMVVDTVGFKVVVEAAVGWRDWTVDNELGLTDTVGANDGWGVGGCRKYSRKLG